MALCMGNSIAEPKFVKGELLIKFVKENNTEHKTKEFFPGTKIHVISVPEHAEVKVRDALSKNPNVEFVELNALHAPVYTPNDPRIGNQWWLNTINAYDAMDVAYGQGVTVGVCDTGVNNHEDLQGMVLNGWNFYGNNDDVTNSGNGHGTGVAGTIAANTNNGLGVASPAYGVQIIPGRIADDSSEGWSTGARMVACQEYMADRGVKVINLSYGGCCGSANYAAAKYADSKGATVHWAAGNSGQFLTDYNSVEQTIASATTSSNTRASFSNYGGFVDLAAPGSGVYSIYGSGSQYGNLSGTSFSSPITAAVAAMVYSKNPGISAQQVRDILYSTATDLGDSSYYGHGLVNALAAVNANITLPPPPVDPVCGNNVVESDEQCDDGNVVNGDGCDSICRIEVTLPPPPDVDEVGPVIVINKPKNGQQLTRLSLKGTISDNVMLDYAEVHLNGGLAKYMNLADKVESRLNFNWRGPRGTHSITVIAVDLAGNETLESVTFEIVGRK